MKKLLVFLVAIGMSAVASATILRVSNVTGSSAPYSSIDDALKAAANGDTIMVEGSETSYGDCEITKQVVLIGPGYMQIANGISQEGTQSAKIRNLFVKRSNVEIQGMEMGYLYLNTNNIVVTRCLLSGIELTEESSGCIIHQNHVTRYIDGNKASHATITNNIFNFKASMSWDGLGGNGVKFFDESYIAYNSWTKTGDKMYHGLTNTTVEYNIHSSEYVPESSSVSANNNYVYTETSYYNTESELDIREDEKDFSEGKYGAFAGDDPYIISGIPAGPVIEDVTIPASVEQGENLNVTIKLGIQQ